MYDLIVWLAVGAVLTFTIVQDCRAGEIRLPRRGHSRRPRTPLRRSEYPLLFVTILTIRVLGALALVLLLTGKLLPLLE